ncbi:hypothetical protein AQUCO_11400029v1 [Aquilegia coerulea]|uniref:Uncharacterized protein n=1 Tax=Aquilegia coerulea TaxID=218851 RepID=A0A2G5C2H1_AQUCA|nr:hypothetical protein AQUCO_11400029v1 [Aquilegia coerulea]
MTKIHSYEKIRRWEGCIVTSEVTQFFGLFNLILSCMLIPHYLSSWLLGGLLLLVRSRSMHGFFQLLCIFGNYLTLWP